MVHRLIAHASVRYSTIEQVSGHPFFTNSTQALFPNPRMQSPPFVPSLDSEIDTGYYDDFTSLDDMAKYAEVQAKKNNVDRMVKDGGGDGKRGVWVGFTFGKTGVASSTREALREGKDENGEPEGLFTIF